MFYLLKKKVDLKQIKIVAQKLAQNSNPGDIYLLNGELGSGKTTFTRFFIKSIYKKNLLPKPNSIKSPSFPILINYQLENYEIYHYDFYRIKHNNEFVELGIFENFINNITIIEWPEIY